MLNIAIVGCGKIADDHALQIRRIREAKIVAVCDREPLMARQLAGRLGIDGCFTDVEDLLRRARPDVVHITTPPHSHFPIAKVCLEHGCHVYVEKPFTVFSDEAEELIALASRNNVQITVGHDEQFSHAARRMRALVRAGFLGSSPVHMESYYCYELARTPYSGALLGDKRHWVRQLPGKLLHNIISHGIARVAEFLSNDSVTVIAHGFTSPVLKSLGETNLVDELRVIISQNGRTAYFTFSSQMRPSIHQFRIYGTDNGLVLDQDQETLIRLRGRKRTSYLEKFVSPVGLAQQQIANAVANVRTFLARDFQMKSGMKYLTESFYRSITEGTAGPIPPREILLTARIMDTIFRQLDDAAIRQDIVPVKFAEHTV